MQRHFGISSGIYRSSNQCDSSDARCSDVLYGMLSCNTGTCICEEMCGRPCGTLIAETF